MMKNGLLLLSLLGLFAAGCGSGDVQVTKDDDEKFRNPPKEIPPDIAEKMNRARNQGMQQKGAATGTPGGQ